MSNDPERGTETPVQRIRRLERELTARGVQLAAVQAERDRAVSDLETYRLEVGPALDRLDSYEDDDGAVRGPLLAALHVFHDRHHGGVFRQCWTNPCGSVGFDRNSTSPHAGPAPTALPLVLVPLMEASA